MTNIYYFIEDFYEQKFEECFDLWKKCLTVERPFLQQEITKENLYQMHWWPFHYNGKILVKIADEKGPQEFLHWLGYLSGYPKGLIIANDLILAVEKLIKLPITEQAKLIFEQIVANNPEYFESMKKWLALDIS